MTRYEADAILDTVSMREGPDFPGMSRAWPNKTRRYALELIDRTVATHSPLVEISDHAERLIVEEFGRHGELPALTSEE